MYRARTGRTVSSVVFAAEVPSLEEMLARRPDELQLAIYGASVTAHRLLADRGTGLDLLVGNSFGEIAALVAGGAHSVADGASLVCDRNEILRSHAPEGGLLALRCGRARSELLELAKEMRIRHALPGVVLGGGDRWVRRARSAHVPPAWGPVLAEDAVLLGAGTSRGIGMLTLRGLAENCRPVIHILGTNDLSAYQYEELAEDEAAHRLRRRAALVAAAREEGDVPVANARLRRLAQAREVHADLARLTALCGEGKMHYHVCDTCDPDQVRRVCAEVIAAHGGRPVDLLLNFSGQTRSAKLPAKSLRNFRAVRDIKVDTYHALKHAFAGNRPLRWVNAGSLGGLFGIQGETDYGAANDFLYTAAAESSAPAETAFGWELWDGTTRSTDPLVGEVLDRHMSRMPAAEGVAHFLAELGRPDAVPTLGYFGAVEQRIMREQRPWRTAVWAPEPETAAPDAGPLLGEITELGDGRLVAQREFSVDRDAYLEHHLAGGHPTVPRNARRGDRRAGGEGTGTRPRTRRGARSCP
ncbi:beta-ketoacyl synthase [Amycolatopsis decaplanina DSM 44594]|uniref:Beta-ketoacyl synthase n=1 Tax=Amycolatopsis decaplanina DSM 44594 TaxID=1284240 RepID=M2X1Q1_9PSEU|nr:beta-ketoacyl synthase [Amycolatopsis decaplanina DSM 44594]